MKGCQAGAGWGAKAGYPALVLDPEGERIEGFLFTSDTLDAHWDRLDEFEGAEYQRLLTLVTLGPGSLAQAWVYVQRSNRA